MPYGPHFLSRHPAFMGALSRSQKHVRSVLESHDVAFFVGADVLRMSVWSDVDPRPPGLAILQVSQRDWELAKNYPAQMAIRADVRETLRALNATLEQLRTPAQAEAAAARLEALGERNWSARRLRVLEEADAAEARSPTAPAAVARRLVEALPEDVVLVDEGLTTGATVLSLFPFRDRHCYFGLASGGIGFAVPGAIGIHLALPERPIVAFVGDGSAMYTIQALWTAAHMELPIVYVIANNRSYRILKQRLVAFHGNDRFIGMDFSSPPLDFVGLAESMGVRARRVESAVELGDALRSALSQAGSGGGPRLLDVAVDADL